MNVEDPIELLLTVHELLTRQTNEFATYGALALAAYGAPRFIADTDLDLNARAVSDVMGSLRDFFPLSVIALDEQPFGGLQLTRLTVFDDSDRFNTIDLVSPMDGAFGCRLLERVLEGELRGKRIRMVSPEDFVLLELLSTRDREIADASSVSRQSTLSLDLELIECEIEALAKTTDHPIRARWHRVRDNVG